VHVILTEVDPANKNKYDAILQQHGI